MKCVKIATLANQAIDNFVNLKMIFECAISCLCSISEIYKIILLNAILRCQNEFSQSNFGLSEYTNERGKTYPMYEITKDGFSFLVMDGIRTIYNINKIK